MLKYDLDQDFAAGEMIAYLTAKCQYDDFCSGVQFFTVFKCDNLVVRKSEISVLKKQRMVNGMRVFRRGCPFL